MILVDCFWDSRLIGQPIRINGGGNCIYQQTSCMDISLICYSGIAELAEYQPTGYDLCVMWMGIS